MRSSPLEDITREAARGTSLILAGALLAQAVEYFYRFLMARGLGVSGFGTFSQARSIYLILIVLAPLGLAAGVKQFVAVLRESGQEREARRVIAQGIRLATASSIVLAALLWVFAPVLAGALRNPELDGPLRMLAFAIPAAVGLDIVTRLGEAFRSFRPTVVARQVLDPALRVLLTLPLLAAGASLTVLLGAMGVSAAIALAVAVILVRKLERFRSLTAGPAPSQLPALLQFSLPLAGGTALFDFAERIDILMIGFYLDEADVGIYSAASSIARFLLIFTASTMPVVATLAAEAAGRGTVHEMGRLQRTTTRWMLFFTGPLAAGLLLYPEEAILFLFGGEFAGGASSLRILVLASLVPILTGPIGLLLDALGKTRWTLANVFFRLVINFSLNLLLIPRFGISGAACGTLAALAIAAIFQWIQLAKLVPLAGNYRGWGVPLAALAGSAALSFGSHWALSSILPGETGRILSALISGAILVLCFGFAVRRIPGCLEDADREVIRLVWNRARFTGGLSGRR